MYQLIISPISTGVDKHTRVYMRACVYTAGHVFEPTATHSFYQHEGVSAATHSNQEPEGAARIRGVRGGAGGTGDEGN